MAWLQVHQELGRHPKIKRLSKALGVTTPTAIGHLLYLWWFALDYAQDGDISAFSPEEIAEAALWESDASKFLSAMTNCGFIDNSTDGMSAIHDWDDYAGALMDRLNAQREQSRIRQQRYRERQRETDDNALVTRDVTHSVTGCHALREDKKREEKSIQEESKRTADKPRRFTPPSVKEVAAYCVERSNSVDPQRFVDYYESVGWCIGKKSMRDWKAAVRTWECQDNTLQKGASSQSGADQRDYTKIPDGYAGL